MALHFDQAEFAGRVAAAQSALVERQLDGLLIFRPESMYYLSGFDTFGYAMFQCMYLGADGRMVLLTRAPDRAQAELTSTLSDIRIWTDEQGHNPALQLKEMLQSLGCAGKNLGIELDTVGLNASQWLQVNAALDSFCTLTDASALINELRFIKSDAEIACIERAAELADDALDAAMATARSGVSESDILADMQGAVFRGGGDYAGNEFIIGSGEYALLCRYHSGRRVLGQNDQLTLEWAGCFHRYHAAMMRTVLTGEPSAEHIAMHGVAEEALRACEDKLKPGFTLGDVFDAHARVADAGGLKQHRLNACGYTMGCAYAPIWVDHPMIYTGNPLLIQPNMVFFLHMIFVNRETRRAMTVGHSLLVTEKGNRRLSRSGTELLVVS